VLPAPFALAQGAPTVAVSIVPPPEAVPPLQGTVTFPFNVVVYCPPAAMLPPGLRVDYAVTRIPSWATVTVSPTSDTIDPLQCQPPPAGSQAIRHGTLTVSATADAPAFTPDVVELEARVTMPTGEQGRGRASAPVIAGFFSILDATPLDAAKRAAPGQSVAFPVRVINFGNANTRVSFDLQSAGEGARVVLPADVTLQSRQSGGSQFASDVLVGASRLPGAVGDIPIIVHYKSHYALDPHLQGDSGTFALLLRGGGADPEPVEASSADPPSSLRQLPLSPLAAIVAGIGAALLRRRA
jgi:hypothetical protein